MRYFQGKKYHLKEARAVIVIIFPFEMKENLTRAKFTEALKTQTTWQWCCVFFRPIILHKRRVHKVIAHYSFFTTLNFACCIKCFLHSFLHFRTYFETIPPNVWNLIPQRFDLHLKRNPFYEKLKKIRFRLYLHLNCMLTAFAFRVMLSETANFIRS